MGNRAHGQCGDRGQSGTGDMGHMAIEAHRGMGYRVWATWAIGHMANGAHGQWGLWAMGAMGNGAHAPMGDLDILPITSLILDGFLQKFY